MPDVQRFFHDFTGNADTNYGTRNTAEGTTPSGLVDMAHAPFARIQSEHLALHSMDGLGFLHSHLEVPVSDLAFDAEWDVVIPPGSFLNRTFILELRGKPYENYFGYLKWRGCRASFDSVAGPAGSTSTRISIGTSDYGVAPVEVLLSESAAHRIQFRATGVSPCVLKVTTTNLQTGAVVNTQETSVTEAQSAIPSTNGVAAIYTWASNRRTEQENTNSVALFRSVKVSEVGAALPLLAGKPTFVRADGTNTLTAHPQNQSGAAVIGWKEAAYPDLATYPAVGVNSITLTRSALTAATLRFYRYTLTDGAASVTSPAVMIESPLPPLPSGPLRSDVPGWIIVDWGDSNTASNGPSGARSARLTEMGVPHVVINAGHSGSRLTHEWNRDLFPETTTDTLLERTLRQIQAQQALHPTWRVLMSGMIGTNDALNLRPTRAAFKAAYQKLVDLWVTEKGYLMEIKTPPVLHPASFGQTSNAADYAEMRAQIDYREAQRELVNGTTVFNGDRRAWWKSYANANYLDSGGVHLTQASDADMGRDWAEATRYGVMLGVPLTGITVTSSAPDGQGRIQFSAAPQPSNSAVENLVWSVPATEGTISASGLFTPTPRPAARAVTVTATSGSVQGQATITIPGSDTTAPTITSVVVQASGTTAQITLSEIVTGLTGFTFSVAGQARAATLSGTGQARTATFASVIYQGEAVTYSYTGDGLVDAGGNHPASVSDIQATNSSTQTLPATAPDLSQVVALLNQIKTKTDFIPSDVDGKSLTQALRIIAASVAGKLSGAAGSTITVKGLDGVTTRLIVTTDQDGNRTNVTYP